MGLLSNEREDWIRTVTLRLKKPCPFLENDRCSIYPVRPLPCILFPEYLVNEGTFEANARQDHFKDYLCFQRPIPLSPERATVMTQLKAMWRRESLISSFFSSITAAATLTSAISSRNSYMRPEAKERRTQPGNKSRCGSSPTG